MANVAIIYGLVLLAIGGLWLAAAFIPATGSQIDEFTRAYRLTPGPMARRMIRHQLTVGRRVRNLLILDALVLPPLFTAAFIGSSGWSLDLLTVVTVVLACAVLGAAITELIVSRPGTMSTRRTAVLIPREPSTYLSETMRWWPPIGAVSTVPVLVTVHLDQVRGAGNTFETPPATGTVISSLVILAVPLVAMIIGRWIVRRPQPFVAEDLVAADNALREATIRRIYGLAGTVVGLFLASALFVLGFVADSTTIGSIAAAGALGALAAALVSFRSRHLRAPRQRKDQAAAT